MRLLLARGHYIGSRPGTEATWQAGEEREVPEDTGRYLLADFDGLFLLVEPEPEPEPVVTPAPSAPPKDRAMRGSRWR
jgi:hypothetical protein